MGKLIDAGQCALAAMLPSSCGLSTRGDAASMNNAFEARPIYHGSLHAAFAVLRLGVPDATLKACRALCGRDGAGRPKQGGLIGVFDQRGYVHAVARVRIESILPSGQRMKIYDLVLSDTIATAFVSALVEAMETFARTHGCGHLTIAAPGGHQFNSFPLPGVLASRGFDGQGVLMGRSL